MISLFTKYLFSARWALNKGSCDIPIRRHDNASWQTQCWASSMGLWMAQAGPSTQNSICCVSKIWVEAKKTEKKSYKESVAVAGGTDPWHYSHRDYCSLGQDWMQSCYSNHKGAFSKHSWWVQYLRTQLLCLTLIPVKSPFFTADIPWAEATKKKNFFLPTPCASFGNLRVLKACPPPLPRRELFLQSMDSNLPDLWHDCLISLRDWVEQASWKIVKIATREGGGEKQILLRIVNFA